MRLIQLCDTFHLPLVSSPTSPGSWSGSSPSSEASSGPARGWYAVLRQPDAVAHGRRAASSTAWRDSASTARRDVPPLRVALGELGIDAHRGRGDRRPTGARSSRRRTRPQARGDRGAAEAIASPFRTAEATGQDIIDPRDTRPLVCEFVEDAQPVLRTQLGATAVPYRP